MKTLILASRVVVSDEDGFGYPASHILLKVET